VLLRYVIATSVGAGPATGRETHPYLPERVSVPGPKPAAHSQVGSRSRLRCERLQTLLVLPTCTSPPPIDREVTDSRLASRKKFACMYLLGHGRQSDQREPAG